MILDLEEGEGQVHLLLTISGLSQRAWSEEVDGEDSSIVSVPSQVDWGQVEKKYVRQEEGTDSREERQRREA